MSETRLGVDRYCRVASCSGEHADDEVWHGTLNGYKKHACRCYECKFAKRDEYEKYREADLERSARYRAENADAIRVYNRERYERYRASCLAIGKAAYSETARLARERAVVFGGYAPSEDQFLIETHETHTRVQQALVLGRTYGSVRSRITRLRKAGVVA
ncbi:hypothetical protein [Nocardioides sp. SYSU D00038]|uniref:hypothetical protein n=1 Tax=Nocardioides sp. SYSU D00038 TaxID=2812554 RepID=UPI00196836DD|nr:hypothetical protein [Nocardioides sp. SYSU D00038]